jgi:microcystin-dependent protein
LEGVLLAVATVPVQQKRKNIPPLQIGNNVTRNFLVEFSGAQALTGITVDASTWQHDFTVRLNGIDLRERLSNHDVFGRVCFLAESLQMERSFSLYQVKAGVAYVEGIRVELDEPVHVQLPALPVKAWLDVALARQGNETVAAWKVVFGEVHSDYIDSNGTVHYVVELARVAVSGAITDLRQSEPLTGALVTQFALRSGDYANLRARATTKEDVDLGELPNAKSDDPSTDSSEVLATTKALQALRSALDDETVGMTGLFSTPNAPAGWLKENGAAISRITFARLFAKIGTRFGAGDGISTFNLRDSRGKFPRFWDDGRGIDVGRVLGSDQDDEIRSHNHTGSAAGAGSHTHGAWSDTQGAHTHNVHHGDLTPDGSDFGTPGEPRNPLNGSDVPAFVTATTSAGAHAHNITINAVGDHSHAITVYATGGSETRPGNTAYLACIKY